MSRRISLEIWLAATFSCILLLYYLMVVIKGIFNDNLDTHDGDDICYQRRYTTLLFVGVITLLAIFISSNITINRKYRQKAGMKQKYANPNHKFLNKSSSQNNVVFIEMNKIEWKILHTSLHLYRSDTNHILEHLSIMLEVVEMEEKSMLQQKNSAFLILNNGSNKIWMLSDHIRTKIVRLSALYDHDMNVLQEVIMLPFTTIHALPSFTIPLPLIPIDNNYELPEASLNTKSANDRNETKFTWGSNISNRKLADKFDSYDSIRQVIAHLVRDWSSVDGARIRKSIYSWCVTQLQLYQHVQPNGFLGPILVPGAGVGRLVWEINRKLNCTVEGIESSICMTAAAHTILHLQTKNAFSLHPYSADPFSNEIDSDDRYDKIYFPDVNPAVGDGTISYTVGKFSYDSMQHCPNQYGAIVTSFFIDTATTIYDFISTIAMILKGNGLWVNVGPLQWHINNQVPVSANELRMIIENIACPSTGKKMFHILHWSVDTVPTRYRNDGGTHRSTYYDGYCPLRFVLKKAL